MTQVLLAESVNSCRLSDVRVTYRREHEFDQHDSVAAGKKGSSSLGVSSSVDVDVVCVYSWLDRYESGYVGATANPYRFENDRAE